MCLGNHPESLSEQGRERRGSQERRWDKVAKKKFLTQGNNRVILGTDGDFNVGVSSLEELTKLIERQRDRNIYLTCLGVADDNLQDGAMELLAVKGNGGTARLVMLPHESHGYRARESVLHVLAEMFEWADRYVKDRPDSAGLPAAPATRAAGGTPGPGR